MKVIITIEAEIDELEAKCFNNNMTDENLDGQADLIKDIMRLEGSYRPLINWKVEANSNIQFNPWRLIGIK